MPGFDRAAAALEPLHTAVATGRLAHAHLIVGSPRGAGLAAAERMLELVFCAQLGRGCGHCRGCQLVRRHAHPDVRWIEPESLSRQITIGDPANRDADPGIRYGFIEPMGRSAIEGGWKAGVVLAADRMTAAAANALLKTLEEPPPQTLLLLVTDAPHRLPATIVSRCHRLTIEGGETSAPEPWRSRFLDLLAEAADARDLLARMGLAARMARLFEELQKAAEESVERAADGGDVDGDVLKARRRAAYLEQRALFFREWLAWERDVLVARMGLPDDLLRHADRADSIRREAARSSTAGIAARIRGIEDMDRRLRLNISLGAVLMAFFRDAGD